MLCCIVVYFVSLIFFSSVYFFVCGVKRFSSRNPSHFVIYAKSLTRSLSFTHFLASLTQPFCLNYFACVFGLLLNIVFFCWCSLNFGRVYIKPWKKRILCTNLRWFWCCERSNALKKINRRSEFITHHKNQRISWKRQIKLANKCKIIWSWWMSSQFLHKNEFTVSVVSIGAI